MTTDTNYIEHRVTFTCPCRRELVVVQPGGGAHDTDAKCDCGQEFTVASTVTHHGEAVAETPEPAEEAPNPATPFVAAQPPID